MLVSGAHCIRQSNLLASLLKDLPRCFTTTTNSCAKHSKKTLPSTPARTRFAPSPTGYLHLGSLRTALFNYLLAKKTGGQFLLRIEDTDQKRTVPGAVDRLCSDLKWAGLQWDEGPDTDGGPFGPYRQSQRTPLYREHAHKLLDSGHAYRCFCTAERLDELARQRNELGLPTDYDRQCAGISKEESDSRADAGEGHVIRLLAPDTYPDVTDLVYGRIGKAKGPNTRVTIKHGEISYEDPVLLKTDGHPTYHLANVVDDHFMEITHVVRATEWISSTPKHLALYEAFGWTPPAFAHVGLLVDEAGHKLSKRNFDTDIAHFRDMGILPSTLVNFVALLGWSHSQRSDVMSLDELVDQFQMQFTKGNTTVTLEKLWFLQRSHAVRAAAANGSELEDMARRVDLAVRGILDNISPEPNIIQAAHQENPVEGSKTDNIRHTAMPTDRHSYILHLLKIDAKNYTTPADFAARNLYFFIEPAWSTTFAPTAANITIATTTDLVATANQIFTLTPAEQWNTETLNKHMKHIITTEAHSQERNDKTADATTILAREKLYNKLFHDFLRWMLLGGAEGPSSAPMMALLGRDVCADRFERAGKVLSLAAI